LQQIEFIAKVATHIVITPFIGEGAIPIEKSYTVFFLHDKKVRQEKDLLHFTQLLALLID
jgi:hypothetical protein